jgi:hypothetical protein
MQGAAAMKYEVNVTRDGRWWMIEVPAIDGLTQARRVSEIEDQAKSLIATMLDVAASEVEIEVASVMVGEVDALALATQVREARRAAAEAEEQAAKAMSGAVTALVGEQAPVRDIGELLGVSHQRVSQLA